MKTAIITGSAGLIGSESVRYFAPSFDLIIGIDNDFRARFFGKEASVNWNKLLLTREIGNYRHLDVDICDQDEIHKIFEDHGSNVELVIHTAAQPSHDYASTNPKLDFAVNATGTLNLLESCRKHAPEAVFIYTSSNKVYGDRPNLLPLLEQETRYELEFGHPYASKGISERMRIDQTLHSIFGASKVAADIMVQEYGRYFGMNTGVFRGGCLSGPAHSGAKLHGFLAYLMRCIIFEEPYTIIGHKGKQVRDNLHSRDLVRMFDYFREKPRAGEVYNAGGGRSSNVSMLEAIKMGEEITGKKLQVSYEGTARRGDHRWWISDTTKFETHYPGWSVTIGIEEIMQQLSESLVERREASSVK